MFPNRCYERQNNDLDANIFAENIQGNVDIDVNMAANNNVPGNNMMMPGSMNRPIVEPMQERVVNRTFCHEVPHVCPMRTRIINHHVFRHTYRPEYSCCEENVSSTINTGSCCQFR